MQLGHVNLWVSDLDRSADFYGRLLGIPEVARGAVNGRRVAFFSFGERHHDLALIDLGGSPGGRRLRADPQPGLNHIAFKVGDSLAELRAIRDRLASFGVAAEHTVDHRVCKSIHVIDPDGLTIELYVDDASELWRKDPAAMMHSELFEID